MKIVILGAGAMGSLYGGPLSVHHEVWLLDVWKEHVEKINKEGLVIRQGDTEFSTYHPKAAGSAGEIGTADLAIIFVKSVDTSAALAKNREIFGPDTMVLTLQNGYGNDEDILPYIKSENLFVGTTACGATMLGPGEVFQAGKGMTSIGVTRTGSLERAQQIADVLEESGFAAKAAPDVMEAVWTKLLVNVGLNAPLALLGVRNGFIGDSPHAMEIGKALVAEGVAVAEAEGVRLDGDAIVQHYYVEGSKVVGKNRCSMLQDIDRKRKTEIEKINGAIVRLGRRHGISTPYNEVFTLLVQAKEESYHYE